MLSVPSVGHIGRPRAIPGPLGRAAGRGEGFPTASPLGLRQVQIMEDLYLLKKYMTIYIYLYMLYFEHVHFC